MFGRLAFAFSTACAIAVALPPLPAHAEESLYVPLLTYRTGPYAGSGIGIADGMHDYLEMLNRRDGGIGGVKLALEECETGYNSQKGVECYEATKGKGALVYNPWSTGITLQLIPKAGVDKIPVLSMAYGLSAAADGKTFPWVFNPPTTYWDGASVAVKYIASKEGGLAKLKGKKIGYIYLDAPYGKEPIPLLEALAKENGFELAKYPVPGDKMQDQASQWLNVQSDAPDWMIMWGWGAMNPTAVKEAAKIGYPMDHFLGVWFSGGDDDAKAGGAGAKGFLTLNFNGTGPNYPALADIKKHVVDKGLSTLKDAGRLGENNYNRGVYNSMLIAEAVRNAQKISGKKAVTGEDVRRGFETLNIDEARLKAMGMEGFANPMKLTCADHSGHNKVFVSQWDGAKYVKASEWMDPIKDVVRPLIEEEAKSFVGKDPGWPKRTEACDKAG